ncbi:MAG: ATP-binding protein [Desulfuromonadaceae bacterium]|nr:ATP-binding protein [Desulfuromonadaceae bacterium]
MRRIRLLIVVIPACFTLLVGWFSWSAYFAAPQVAGENLRGAGLTMASAIEQFAAVGPDLRALTRYSTPDLAYYFLVDDQGVIRFHTNPALIGTVSAEAPQATILNDGIVERRKRLGTGEEIYVLETRIHPAGASYILTLALHTYRADQVIRRAHTGISVVTSLTISLWLLILGVMFLLRRDEKHRVEMLRRAELARLGEMGAVMAHEIRNPLAGIKGFAQLIENATDLEQACLYADKIVSQSIRMELLVNDLLTFVREERGDHLPTDLSELLGDVVAIIRVEADPTGVEVTYSSHPPLTVMAAPDRITQLLINLLKNGLQAMPCGGQLHIDLERRAGLAVITVCDSGIGIPPENIPHIFEPFWTSKARGTGLGLALCRKVAQEHGGSLAVESIPGTGTTFTLTVPLAP